MIGKWFQKDTKAPPTTIGAPDNNAERVSQLSRSDQALISEVLCSVKSLLPITEDDIAILVRYLEPRRYQPGEVLIKEGNSDDVDYMLWILDGEVTIEGVLSTREEPVTLTVLEPGRMLGEMSFLDGSPRSVSCTAYTAMRCAQLTSASLQELATRHPEVASRLLCNICIGISSRLRAFNLKFMRHVIVNHLMRQEINSGSFDEPRVEQVSVNHNPAESRESQPPHKP